MSIDPETKMMQIFADGKMPVVKKPYLGIGNMWTKLGSSLDSTKGILLFGLFIGIAGCHSKTASRTIDTSRVSSSGSGKLAESGRVSIVTVCAKESFAVARQGLIVAETGLREDVFLLRDRDSYNPVPYGLEDARRLEVLLRAEIGSPGHTEEQADCIRKFAEHLESLTEPLTEAARREREIDTSTFSKADKQVQDELERESNAKIPH